MSEMRAVVLGPGGVGKSALTIQFVRSMFVDKYDPTIEDSYRKSLTVDGRETTLNILDTAGQEEYASLRPQYVRSGQGFLLVYAVNDLKSFEELRNLYDEILRIKDAEVGTVPVVIVGNKCDLEDQREVSAEAAREFATARNCAAVETSAKANLNVTEAFAQVVKAIRSKLPEEARGHGKKKTTCTVL